MPENLSADEFERSIKLVLDVVERGNTETHRRLDDLGHRTRENEQAIRRLGERVVKIETTFQSRLEQPVIAAPIALPPMTKSRAAALGTFGLVLLTVVDQAAQLVWTRIVAALGGIK